MATIGYLDIGAVQRKESGSPTANTGYLDLGAVQRQETAAGKRFILIPFVWPFWMLLALFTQHFMRE